MGASGVTGLNGATGVRGASGVAGIIGASGVNGSTGPSGDRYSTTSTSSLTLTNTGSTGITVGTALNYSVGQNISIAYSVSEIQYATISSYNPGTGDLVFVNNAIVGSGTYTAWAVNLDGAVGTGGATGPSGTSGVTGATGPSGTSGITGASGVTGATGTLGLTGSTGPAGTLTGATGPIYTAQVAPTIASASTISPTKLVSFISGIAAVATITVPTNLTTTGGMLILIPTDLCSFITGGNIAIALTPVVGEAISLTYDATTTKWYPSLSNTAISYSATGDITANTNVGVYNYGILSYSDTNIFSSFTTSVNTYAQAILENNGTGALSSVDYIVSNNAGSAVINYGDFGINGSGFTGSGAFDQANNVYLTATSGDLAIGTTTSNAIHFVIDHAATDAMTISSGGALSINGLVATSNAAPTIASDSTIAPTSMITFVSGIASISTITAPAPISAAGGKITIIPTGAFTLNTSGNIANVVTTVVGQAFTLTYDSVGAKWYPSTSDANTRWMGLIGFN
jgi:hypothetical protein